MYSIRNKIIVITFAFIIALVSNMAAIETSDPNYGEYQAIESLVFSLQQSFQDQDKFQFFIRFIGDPDKPVDFALHEKQVVETALDGLFNTFSARTLTPLLTRQSKTVDFRIYVKEVKFSPDGNAALVTAVSGFVDTPVDSTALNAFTTAQISQMSDIEKLDNMRYKKFQLQLVKITHTWHIVSYGQFLDVINDINSFSSTWMSNQGVIKQKK